MIWNCRCSSRIIIIFRYGKYFYSATLSPDRCTMRRRASGRQGSRQMMGWGLQMMGRGRQMMGRCHHQRFWWKPLLSEGLPQNRRGQRMAEQWLRRLSRYRKELNCLMITEQKGSLHAARSEARRADACGHFRSGTPVVHTALRGASRDKLF